MNLVQSIISLMKSQVSESSLLLEDRLDYLKTQLKDRISFDHDPGAKIKTSDELVDHIASKVDPTTAKVHTQWVANQYRKGALAQEDFPRVKKALKGFELTKKNLEVKDINKFDNLSDLEDHVAVQKNRTVSDIKEKEKGVEATPDKLEKVYDNPEHGIGFKVPNATVSKKLYGPSGTLAKTNWCTASSDATNMFSHYKGGKYTYHTPEGAVLQIHHDSGQIMDERNVNVNLNTNQRYSPHKEAIKDFVAKTHVLEGGSESSPSKLMRQVGSGVSKEHLASVESEAEQRMSRGSSYLGNNHTKSLETNPHSPEHFQKVMDWTKTMGGSKGSHYDDHIEAQVAMAQNPNTPDHILNELHEAHKHSEHKSAVHGALAINPSVKGSVREELKSNVGFAKRTDLTPEETSHIIKHGEEDQRSNLYQNHAIPIAHEDQKAAFEKEDKDLGTYSKQPILHLLNRPDLHHDVADAVLEHHFDKLGSSDLIHKASPDFISKNYSKLDSNKVYTHPEHEQINPEVHENLIKEGKISPSIIRPEHADLAATSGKYNPSQILYIKGVSKEHVDNAANSILESNKSKSDIADAYKHPKVSNPIKEKLAGSLASSHDPDYSGHRDILTSMPIAHITSAINSGNVHAKKVLASAKNIQKSHFDELIKDPRTHGAIVASKSAPPSILSQLANSPSDYIKSKVKKHKNTPPDVAAKIEVNEENV